VRVTLFSVAVILFVVAAGYRQVKETAKAAGTDIRDMAGHPGEGDGQCAAAAGWPPARSVGRSAEESVRPP
jgi:hypothetical protein